MLYRFLYVFLVIFLALLLLEAALRLLDLAPKIPEGLNLYTYDRYLPYKAKPLVNKYLEGWGKEYRFLSKHNSVGLRDVEHSLEKPGAVFRIIGLGDSFAYGVGASFEDTYLYKLEAMFNSRLGNHPKVEIIKAGIPGFFPEPERIFLEYYGIVYQPDLILVSFLPNDLIETYYGLNALRVSPDGYLKSFSGSTFGEFVTQLYFHSYLCRNILGGLHQQLVSKSLIHWNDIYKKNGFYEKSWEKIEKEFSQMNEISRSIGAIFAIVYIPQNDTQEKNKIYPAVRLAGWCRANGVVFIDTLPVLQSAVTGRSFYWKEGHCNKEGYQAIAEKISYELLRQGLIP